MHTKVFVVGEVEDDELTMVQMAFFVEGFSDEGGARAPKWSSVSAFNEMEHAFVLASAFKPARFVGVVGVAVACVDRAVEKFTPCVFFGGVGKWHLCWPGGPASMRETTAATRR